ncbi:serine/threonine-protein phosphatase 4 regulatory subunit 1 isoform X1 [Alosa sapidissima]|uniref:serine/threonine-protein phosphatase 4 regulatory subunit 1 isoform X1 n=2 Tax=Alosa sapidissima TaxID=34773 RepID=UPI001C09A7C9|nr:serine/threonine-protein phosphatase 4 regulatory subunit 1 isoform X1 [Alosa sapidissima]XP_041923890.1 serine/threonine-protein phosphatase 4 regulatory subunit 1 isoform X1 [Alosa sapidissima]
MADLSLLQEDSQEELDGFGVDDYSESDVIIIPSALDFVSQDEMLTPLGRLDKYVASENIFNRQMVARSLLDTLKAVSEDERDCIAVLERVSKLADDSEPTVRAELMEQVPHIAIFCQENKPSIPYAFSKYLLPIVVRYLADPNNQVRKTSQAALLVLLEQELIDRVDIENLVCPVLVDLTAPDSNDDVKTEAMAIICKMAPMVGKDITERLFLPRFCEMCCDCRMFHVRKVCAANFGDICSVVGGEATEELLLPRFFQLCSDNVWGVRKACAECFMSVSSATSPEVRRTKLSSLFINLISDPSRWVRQAAFQSLGQFISTFASPSSNVGQYFKEGGEEGEWTAEHSQKNSAEEKSSNSDTNTAQGSLTAATEMSPEDSPVDVEQKDNVTSDISPDSTSQNSSNAQGDVASSCRMEEDGNMDVAEEGGGEQAAEVLNGDMSCCHGNTDSRCLLGEMEPLHNASEPDPGPLKEEPPYPPEEPVADQQQPPNSAQSTTAEKPPNTQQNNPEGENPVSSTSTEDTAAAAGDRDSTSSPAAASLVQTEDIPEQELFNSFHFWRTPIPEIDLDLELQEEQEEEGASPNTPPRSSGPPLIGANMLPPALGRKQLEELIENLEPHIDDPDVKAQVDVLTAALRATALDAHLEDAYLEPRTAQVSHDNPFEVHQVPLLDSSDLENQDPTLQISHGDDSDMSDSSMSPEEEKRSKQQDVIPQALLDQYLSMTDPSRAQTVDMEIAKHCAYSLPGVAFTLGRQNWHCLRDTYETLASDMQWKVRRTLAFSIHELALILGDQLTAADLVPIFNSFLKDLDEVRIGVLKHLYDFLKLLHQETRRKYLYQLQEFLVTDNSRNWRFRSELSEQLVLLLELYSAQDVYDYLRPLAFKLCTDRVSSVRWTSYRLVSEIIRKLSTCPSLLVDFLSELVEKFCHCPKWSGRQAFAFVCQLVIEDGCLSLEQFSEHLLAPLLQLATDPVPNVRVLLAKTIRQSILEREYFLNSANCHNEALEHTLVALQMDMDKDVKYFASVHPSSTRINEDAMSTTSSTY